MKSNKPMKTRLAEVEVGKLEPDPEILEIRPINTAVVSTYRQNKREGHIFPRPVVTPDWRIICGNHRTQADLLEFGPDHVIEVEVIQPQTEREAIKMSVADNITHGLPLSGISVKIALNKLLALGCTPEEMAKLFGRPLGQIKKLAGITVMVTPNGKGAAVPKPVKRGLEHLAGKQVSKKKYEEHIKHDMSGTARTHADQLSRWLENGWVKLDDAKTLAALLKLTTLLNKTLKAVKAA
jgi:hypothetical protein